MFVPVCGTGMSVAADGDVFGAGGEGRGRHGTASWILAA